MTTTRKFVIAAVVTVLVIAVALYIQPSDPPLLGVLVAQVDGLELQPDDEPGLWAVEGGEGHLGPQAEYGSNEVWPDNYVSLSTFANNEDRDEHLGLASMFDVYFVVGDQWAAAVTTQETGEAIIDALGGEWRGRSPEEREADVPDGPDLDESPDLGYD